MATLALGMQAASMRASETCESTTGRECSIPYVRPLADSALTLWPDILGDIWKEHVGAIGAICITVSRYAEEGLVKIPWDAPLSVPRL